MRERTLPKLVAGPEIVIKADMLRAIGFAPFPPLIDIVPENKTRISESLDEFCDQMTGSQELNNLVNSFGKSNCSIPDGKFRLQAISGKNDFRYLENSMLHSEAHGTVYLDGHHGLVLGLDLPNTSRRQTTWLSSITFSPAGEVSRREVLNNVATIVQLQSVINAGNTNLANQLNDRKKFILKTFRWEHALVELLCLWSAQNRLPAIYINPSSANKYLDRVPQKRLYMRYDVTAKRTGFAKDPMSGLYVAFLGYLPSN